MQKQLASEGTSSSSQILSLHTPVHVLLSTLQTYVSWAPTGAQLQCLFGHSAAMTGTDKACAMSASLPHALTPLPATLLPQREAEDELWAAQRRTAQLDRDLEEQTRQVSRAAARIADLNGYIGVSSALPVAAQMVVAYQWHREIGCHHL